MKIEKYIRREFESTDAFFKLTTETLFTREKQDKTKRDTISITDKGTIYNEAGTYLVFTYFVADDFMQSKSVYTSAAQLKELKAIVKKLENAIDSGEAFNEIDNKDNEGRVISKSLLVNPKFSQPFTVQNIGVKNAFISFQLRTDVFQDNNGNFFPSVSITIPGAPTASVLSLKEFFMISLIIQELNLGLVNLLHSQAFLSTKISGGTTPTSNSGTRTTNTRQTGGQNGNYNRNNYNQGNQIPQPSYGQSPYGNGTAVQNPYYTQQSQTVNTTKAEQPSYNDVKPSDFMKENPKVAAFTDEVEEFESIDEDAINSLFDQ